MITAIENLFTALKSEVEKFEKGNKSAGTRARKILQYIKAEAKVVRDAIQDKKSEPEAK